MNVQELRGRIVIQSGGNPGAVTVLARLSQIEGGAQALERLTTHAPELKGSKIWELYKDKCGEQVEVFRDAVNQYLDAKGAPQAAAVSSAPVTSPKDHLKWCVDRAMEYANAGDYRQAIASFLSDTTKHPGTADCVHGNGRAMMSMFILQDGAKSPASFRKAMEGFNV